MPAYKQVRVLESEEVVASERHILVIFDKEKD